MRFFRFDTQSLRRWMVAAALAIPMAALAVPQAKAGVLITVGFGPPPLPVYVQPPIPGDGYIWTPGYWGYSDDVGYYWVPGTWVLAPEPGLLWTPGYWGYVDGVYGWYGGYWGPHVGFYGGINYGFGYGGIGFVGGEWRGGRFFYNSAVVNYGGVHITNVYVNTTVVHENMIVNANHAAFNGPGGIVREPSPQERQFASERHVQPTAMQMQHQTAASRDRSQLASVNGGHPGTPAARSPEAYHSVAEAHAAAQPISAADRAGAHSPASTRPGGAVQGPRPGAEAGSRPEPSASRPAPPASRPAAPASHPAPPPRSAPAPKPPPKRP
jgi:hypothetical protein